MLPDDPRMLVATSVPHRWPCQPALALPLQNSTVGRDRKRDGSSLALGSVDGGEQGDHDPAILAGDQRAAVVEDGPQKILDLQGVIVGSAVDLLEAGPVLGLELGQQV